jgi:hypothetical protein
MKKGQGCTFSKEGIGRGAVSGLVVVKALAVALIGIKEVLRAQTSWSTMAPYGKLLQTH